MVEQDLQKDPFCRDELGYLKEPHETSINENKYPVNVKETEIPQSRL